MEIALNEIKLCDLPTAMSNNKSEVKLLTSKIE